MMSLIKRKYRLYSTIINLNIKQRYFITQHVDLVPILGLGSTSTSLRPGFCVRRRRQYNTICWELNLISGPFIFFWLIVWADEIDKCGWCLPGGKGC